MPNGVTCDPQTGDLQVQQKDPIMASNQSLHNDRNDEGDHQRLMVALNE